MIAPVVLPVAAGDNAAASPANELREAAQAFEAILLRRMLAAARAGNWGGRAGGAMEQYEALRDEHLAGLASERGAFGLADAIERQIAATSPAGTVP